MKRTRTANTLSGGERRLLRGYGPLVARITAFTVMVALVPTVARERETVKVVQSGGVPAGAGLDAPAVPTAPAGPHQIAATPTGPNETSPNRASTAAGPNPSRSPGAARSGANRPGGAGADDTDAELPTNLAGAAGVSGCDRVEQVPGDPYSPPCIAFTGDNGGTTSRGVSAGEIAVSFRVTADPVSDFQSAVAQLAGGDATETAEDVRRTGAALVEYFNKSFQFYGRKIVVKEYQGRGALTREILGGGQEQANADAIKVASEIGAFADLTGFSQPYSDALARQQVMAFGAPYMSREWFGERRPYAWSLAPDCSRLAEAGAEYANQRLFGKPAAHAGGDLKGKPRKIGLIAPDNPEYQRCVDSAVALLDKSGNKFATRIAYSLDIASLSNQAASIVARLKAEGITSVACACDPILPVYMTAKAQEQGYSPEWLVVGTALTDTDMVGQLYDQDQWSHAFGGSSLGDQLPRRAGLGYNAYKEIRSDEPSLGVELFYYQLYMFALGVQLAGPNLTPETFETGMFTYQGGIGPAGVWGFGPTRYTPQLAAREIWWDRKRTSSYNGKKGAYVVSSPWWHLGQIPAEDPKVFQ